MSAKIDELIYAVYTAEDYGQFKQAEKELKAGILEEKSDNSNVLRLFHNMTHSMRNAIIEIMKVSQKREVDENRVD